MNATQNEREAAPLLTARELAARLGVSPDTVRRWAREGVIPVMRVRQRTLRFDLADVRAALQEGGAK